MKKLKVIVSLLVLISVLFISVSPALADDNVEPNGKRDIPAVFAQ